MAQRGDRKHQPLTYGLSAAWKDSAELPRLKSFGMLGHLALQAWRSFLSSPLTSILTVITISIALLLFASFVLVLENLRSSVSSSQQELTLSIYLKDDAPTDKIEALRGEVAGTAHVKDVEVRDKTQALEEFKKSLGDQALVAEGLEGQNPLPPSLEVHFEQAENVETSFGEMANRYEANPIVEHISYSRSFVSRLSGLIRLFRVGGAAAIIFLLIITSFIITNTIKLALYSHREEIEIMKLVGATDVFVSAPYMIEGFVQGAIGGVLSVVVLYMFFQFLERVMLGNELTQAFMPVLHFISFSSILLIVGCGIAVGVAGSFFAVRRFMKG